MPPQQRFTKEQIVDAAFAIAAEEGLSGITMRKVAARLGSSVAPIYAHFGNADELLDAVMNKVDDVSRRLLTEQKSGDPLWDIALASVRFAQQYRALFLDLLLRGRGRLRGYNERIDPHLIEQMKRHPYLADLPDAEVHKLLMKLRVFQTGLTIMAATADVLTEEQALELLREAGADLIIAARQRQEGTSS